MNKYQPHVLVLPEDDANRQIAIGFDIELGGLAQFKVLRPAGGWREVLDQFRGGRCWHEPIIPDNARNSMAIA